VLQKIRVLIDFKHKSLIFALGFILYSFVLSAQNISETEQQKITTLEQHAAESVSAGKYAEALADYNSIAELYENNKDYVNAVVYCRKALDAAKKQNAKYRVNAAYFHLINVLKMQKKWEEALPYEFERLSILKSQGNKKAYANALIDVANSLKHLKRYDEAVEKLEEALKISLFELNNDQMTLHCYMELANNYKLLGNEEKYNEYYNLVERIKTEKTTSELKNKTTKAEIKAKLKEKELNVVSDSLTIVAESLTKMELIAKNKELELAKKNAEIEKQAIELKMQAIELRNKKMTILFLSALFLVAFLSAILWYFQYKKKREALAEVQKRKEEIHQQKEEIQAQAEELEFQRDELYRSNKTKEKLLSVVAHDLKNPIHALIGFSELLVDETSGLSDEEKHQYIEYIHDSTLQIHNLLENLLKWAQSQSSSIKYQPEEFNVNELIDTNIKLFNESGKKKEIELIYNLSPTKNIFADKNMINTVIRNLINNAIKFTASGGKISVSAENKDNFVEIMVVDTGVGMSEEIIQKILETDEFHSSAGTSNEQGTGLGLAICKEFLNAHGSKLQIKSRPGKGATFYFSIVVASS